MIDLLVDYMDGWIDWVKFYVLFRLPYDVEYHMERWEPSAYILQLTQQKGPQIWKSQTQIYVIYI